MNNITLIVPPPPPHSDLSHQSAEILFEVYDRGPKPDDPPKFLGLGLVGIDELIVGPTSSQILTLQPRPYETDGNVQGAITVEFVFIEGAEIPAGPRPYKIKEALRLNNNANNGLQNGTDLADTAIRALEGGALSYNGNPSKSTLIIHSVQRVCISQFASIYVPPDIFCFFLLLYYEIFLLFNYMIVNLSPICRLICSISITLSLFVSP